MTIASIDEGIEKLEPYTLPVGMENDSAIFSNSLAVPSNVKLRVSSDLAIPLLGIYPREIKTYIHTKTCTNVHSIFYNGLKSGNNPNVHKLMNG